MAKNNVIVLTTGLSGSSVVTSLISRAGYWTGDNTVKKDNEAGKYNTYENSRLVELNSDLIQSLSFEYDNDAEYQSNAHLLFESAINQVQNIGEYTEFIDYCNSKNNWIWKDPRLWMTIGFWQQFIDKSITKIIIIYRHPVSLWVSHLNKRQIVGFNFLKYAEKKSREELVHYIRSKDMDYIMICYDELIASPSKILPEINNYLGTTLSIEDLEIIYKGKIGKKTWTIKKLITSVLIYIKNYQQRIIKL